MHQLSKSHILSVDKIQLTSGDSRKKYEIPTHVVTCCPNCGLTHLKTDKATFVGKV